MPGRVLWLARPPECAAAAASADNNSSSSGSSDRSSKGVLELGWAALRVGCEGMAQWGVRPSRHALADHHVSRLLGVLGELASLAGTSGPDAA